jgi:hypothetical protein
MRRLFAGLVMFATAAASAAQISFDNVPGRGFADGSLVYQESGFTITSDPIPFPHIPNPSLPSDFVPGTAWSVDRSALASCTVYLPSSSCAFTLTHGGDPFVFSGFGALTYNFDWCNAVSNGAAGPLSGLTLDVTGSLGGITRFHSVQDVHSCGVSVPLATGLGSLLIDRLTVGTVPLNSIFVDDIQVAAVPEPATYALMLAGLLALRHRYRTRSAPRSMVPPTGIEG